MDIGQASPNPPLRGDDGIDKNQTNIEGIAKEDYEKFTADAT
jgi:hypothetical protein